MENRICDNLPNVGEEGKEARRESHSGQHPRSKVKKDALDDILKREGLTVNIHDRSSEIPPSCHRLPTKVLLTQTGISGTEGDITH